MVHFKQVFYMLLGNEGVVVNFLTEMNEFMELISQQNQITVLVV